jgi:DNA-binding NtrC family response regulator
MMDRVVIIDDCSETRKILSSLLSQYLADAEIADAENGASALDVVSENKGDIIILDAFLPDINGVELIGKLKMKNPLHRIILLTAYPSDELFERALELGASCCISKLGGFSEILDTIIRLSVANHPDASPPFESIVLPNGRIKRMFFHSLLMRCVREHVERVAPTDKTIVIEGESGTGKELVARYLHQRSRRQSFPFVPVDCGAIPETLFESEIFGCEKGAFSGADDRRDGLMQTADGGTLLLDEVSNLTLPLQAKLLRVIQEKSYKRLGGTQDIAVDVRVVATTNINLHDAKRSKAFRSDLFYRLNEYCIKVPPLRERKEDLLPLAHCLLEELSQKNGKKVGGFSGEAQEILLRYPWPGNVRELKHELGNAVLACRGDFLLPSDLSAHLAEPPRSEDFESEENRKSFQEQMIDHEKTILEKALEACRGKRTEAAGLLGMNYKTFLRKCAKHGL